MCVRRVKYSRQAARELLSAMRGIVRGEGRQFQAVAEEAMAAYIAKRKRESPRPVAVAHFRASAARNRRLMELLAQCVSISRIPARRSQFMTR